MRTNNSKIQTIAGLADIVTRLKKDGKRVVHCHGVFDLLHPGHLKHFQSAKEHGDILIVTVTPDVYVNRGPGRPIFKQALRAESLAHIECVDFVAVNEWPTAVEAITRIRPDFYVKGNEYAKKEDDVTGKIYDEEQAVTAVGGKLCFTDDITFSATSIINDVLTPYPDEARDFLKKVKRFYPAEKVVRYIKELKDVKVLVIGDIIIDEYHYCEGMGKTPKDNIIATRFISAEQFAGGSLAAANHLAGFCQDVTLLSVVGTGDDYSGLLKDRLKKNIKTKIYKRKDAPTVVKRRFVDKNFLSKMFEICYLDNMKQLPEAIEKKICDYLEAELEAFDMVLVADFGHGLLTPRIIQILCDKAPFLAVNVQTNSSNIGFNLVTKFSRADYVCIDEPELRLACCDPLSSPEKLIVDIVKKMKCKNVVITRGHRGSLAYSKTSGLCHIPVFSKEVVDRIGAGDAFFSITAPCVFRKVPTEIVGVIGNAVGAMKVLIVGNRAPVEAAPLLKYIGTLLK